MNIIIYFLFSQKCKKNLMSHLGYWIHWLQMLEDIMKYLVNHWELKG